MKTRAAAVASTLREHASWLAATWSSARTTFLILQAVNRHGRLQPAVAKSAFVAHPGYVG